MASGIVPSRRSGAKQLEKRGYEIESEDHYNLVKILFHDVVESFGYERQSGLCQHGLVYELNDSSARLIDD